jgi:hypothetical protein
MGPDPSVVHQGTGALVSSAAPRFRGAAGLRMAIAEWLVIAFVIPATVGRQL